MTKSMNEFLVGLDVYLNHLLNPSLMTATDWLITILLIIGVVGYLCFILNLRIKE